MHVPTTSITTRPASSDQPDALQHVEVMGQQVRADTGELTQLERRTVRANELIDDGQADRITKCSMPTRAQFSAGGRFHSITIASMNTAQYLLTIFRLTDGAARVTSTIVSDTARHGGGRTRSDAGRDAQLMVAFLTRIRQTDTQPIVACDRVARGRTSDGVREDRA